MKNPIPIIVITTVVSFGLCASIVVGQIVEYSDVRKTAIYDRLEAKDTLTVSEWHEYVDMLDAELKKEGNINMTDGLERGLRDKLKPAEFKPIIKK